MADVAVTLAATAAVAIVADAVVVVAAGAPFASVAATALKGGCAMISGAGAASSRDSPCSRGVSHEAAAGPANQ